MTRLYLRILSAICLTAWAVNYTGAQNAGSKASAPQKDTLELPFFDDFSHAAGRPDPTLWTSNCVEINNHMPMDPPSTGALMLDALDGNKRFYSNARYGSATPADTIESAPINMQYQGNKSIYMSFYIQRGGLGDAPEDCDSLVLDFYSPTERKWNKVRAFNGGKATPFQQEIIHISENKYLQKGFRFRFRNYISLGSQLAPDLVGNCDYWLIDYVYIDKSRHETDTVYSDVSLTSLPEVLIGGYQEVPWRHYSSLKQKPGISYKINYRNNDSKARLLDSINLYLRHDGMADKYALGTYNMPKYMSFENENNNFEYTLASKRDSMAEYDIEVNLVSDALSSDYAPNNKVSIHKTLSNQYAYDDGTAEAAYGLQGEGASGGLVAVKYHTLMPDAIKGVYMYFCPIYGNRQAESFSLKIWECKDGKPGDAIYTKRNVQVPKGETEQWILVSVDEEVMISDTFFVGWEKDYNEMIAIGFDKNTTSANPKYYNIGGKWKQSKEPGQIMLRPAFGDITTPTHDIEGGAMAMRTRLKVWPNPASEFIRVDGIAPNTAILIISTSGKPVMSTVSGNSEEIDIQRLPAGTYIIHVPKQRASAKFVKTK